MYFITKKKIKEIIFKIDSSNEYLKEKKTSKRNNSKFNILLDDYWIKHNFNSLISKIQSHPNKVKKS